MSTMRELLTKVWKIDMPNLLISVTGGARLCDMKPGFIKVFRRGLMEAASSTGNLYMG